MSVFFEKVFKMKYINRWALRRNSIHENVSEHALEVAMIAHCLATVGKVVYGKDTNPDAVAVSALYHDAAEVITGDIPTPTKYLNPNITSEFKKIEHLATETLISCLPEELQESYRPIIDSSDKYVKAADSISAYLKCVEECKNGNSDFADALVQTENKLEEYDMEEVKYFLDNFYSNL